MFLEGHWNSAFMRPSRLRSGTHLIPNSQVFGRCRQSRSPATSPRMGMERLTHAPKVNLPRIGDRVEVYWEDRDISYCGIITRCVGKSGSRFQVHYDDGDVHVHDLDIHRWRFLPPENGETDKCEKTKLEGIDVNDSLQPKRSVQRVGMDTKYEGWFDVGDLGELIRDDRDSNFRSRSGNHSHLAPLVATEIMEQRMQRHSHRVCQVSGGDIAERKSLKSEDCQVGVKRTWSTSSDKGELSNDRKKGVMVKRIEANENENMIEDEDRVTVDCRNSSNVVAEGRDMENKQNCVKEYCNKVEEEFEGKRSEGLIPVLLRVRQGGESLLFDGAESMSGVSRQRMPPFGLKGSPRAVTAFPLRLDQECVRAIVPSKVKRTRETENSCNHNETFEIENCERSVMGDDEECAAIALALIGDCLQLNERVTCFDGEMSKKIVSNSDEAGGTGMIAESLISVDTAIDCKQENKIDPCVYSDLDDKITAVKIDIKAGFEKSRCTIGGVQTKRPEVFIDEASWIGFRNEMVPLRKRLRKVCI